MPDQYDPVNRPKHYNSHPSGVECIEITRHMSFNLGNAMKYIWRCHEKDDAIEDLRKAIYYINDEIYRLSEAHPHRRNAELETRLSQQLASADAQQQFPS